MTKKEHHKAHKNAFLVRRKIHKVQKMLKHNVRMELLVLNKAEELQRYREEMAEQYDRCALRLQQITKGQYAPPRLPPVLTSRRRPSSMAMPPPPAPAMAMTPDPHGHRQIRQQQQQPFL